MRCLWTTTLAVLLFGPSLAHAQRSVRCRSDEGVLPAGVYWTTVGWYELELRPCPRPRVALVEGIHRRARGATRALLGLRGVAFEPGYPWVVHTRHAGLRGDDGVAVVLGQFEDEVAARRWAAVRGLARARVVGIRSADDAIAQFQSGHGGRRADPIPLVTHVVGAAPVPAYDQEGVLRAESRDSDARAVCRVSPARVFVFDDDPRQRTARFEFHAWMPARCGGRLVWVRKTDTTASAVTWTEATGEAFVAHVTSVWCDVPSYTFARIDESWRRSDERVEEGGCGEP